MLAPVELFREDVLDALRSEARWLHRKTGCPISANDIRHVLDTIGYAGDRRILGAVFSPSEWQPVARVATTTPGHELFGTQRQAIQSYIPR